MRTWVVVVLVAGLLGACDGAEPPRRDARHERAGREEVPWQEAGPLAPAARGVVELRDGTRCGDHWLVVGAVRDGDDTGPAVWSSKDGRAWSSVPVRAHSYYGRRAILQSVACVGDRPVAVGQRSGGAHGNRRVETFRNDDGTWTDVPAPFEQYGGPDALDVGPVSAGPTSWLIAGNRLSGPAVWVASSPRRFALVEDAPGLRDEGDELAIATEAAWGEDAWHLVGGESVGTTRVPRAWSSPDGRHWTRDRVPTGSPLDDMERVAATEDGLLAIGRAAHGFAVWRLAAGGWTRLGDFGAPSDQGGLPDVVDLDVGPDGRLSAVVSDGAVLQLWTSADGVTWEQVGLPVDVPPSGDTAVVIVTSPRGTLLLTDDGSGAKVWVPIGARPDGTP